MVKTGSQAIFLYKFPPMGLLDPLTEYLQARGGGWWPFGIPRTGPRPDVSRPGQDAYIQDTPLDLAAVDELLQENEYLGNQNFGGLDVCVDFVAFIKKCVCFFVWKESVANSVGVLWATVFLLYMVWRRGICKGRFPTISNKICLLVALWQGFLQDRININYVAQNTLYLLTDCRHNNDSPLPGARSTGAFQRRKEWQRYTMPVWMRQQIQKSHSSKEIVKRKMLWFIFSS